MVLFRTSWREIILSDIYFSFLVGSTCLLNVGGRLLTYKLAIFCLSVVVGSVVHSQIFRAWKINFGTIKSNLNSSSADHNIDNIEGHCIPMHTSTFHIDIHFKVKDEHLTQSPHDTWCPYCQFCAQCNHLYFASSTSANAGCACVKGDLTWYFCC